jgi:hypothetical protein
MAKLNFPHDWKSPNYPAVFQHRLDTLQKVRKDDGLRAALAQAASKLYQMLMEGRTE